MTKVIKQFRKEFGEVFFNLHFRYCQFLDTKTNDVCRDERNKIKKRIETFTLKALADRDKEIIKMIEGMMYFKTKEGFTAPNEHIEILKEIIKKIND